MNQRVDRRTLYRHWPTRCMDQGARGWLARPESSKGVASSLAFPIVSSRAVPWGVLIAFAFVVLPNASALAAGQYSVPALLEAKDRWPEMIGMSIQIEGHQTVLGKNSVKLKQLDLTMKSKTPLPKLPGRSRVVEVAGRFAKDSEGKLYFDVESLRELASDADTLRLKESGLPKSPKAYYELANWAKGRGEFYDDPDLVSRAQEINLKGVQLERQELAAVTPAALMALAERARERGLGEALQFDFRHEAFWGEWEALKKSAKPVDPDMADLDVGRDPLFQFLKRLDDQFPGANELSPQTAGDLAKEYAASSQRTYHEADAATRKRLHRLFHVEVATAAINRWIKPDGSNGGIIAEQLDLLIPEQPALAEQHRDRELTYLAKNSATLSRNQLQAVVERCRQRKQEVRATEAIHTWLKRREQSLRKDGVSGLIQLADERLALLQDQPGAAQLLLEALKETPQNSDITERLVKLGYQQVNGEWKLPGATPDPAKPAPPMGEETEKERNIRLGIPTVDMTPAEILRCLGSPSSVTRVAAAGRLTETWVYREGAVVRQSVTIDRPRGRPAKVVAVR